LAGGNGPPPGLSLVWRLAGQPEVTATFLAQPSADSPQLPASLDDLFSLDRPQGAQQHLPVEIHPAIARIVSRVEQVANPYCSLYRTFVSPDLSGEGSAMVPDAALRLSLLEAAERYYGGVYRPRDLVAGSFRELRGEAVDPSDLVLLEDWEYDRAAYPYVRFHHELPLHWARGFHLAGDRLVSRLIPASMAIHRYSWSHPAERLVPQLTVGTASGDSYAHALAHAIFELVERDAFAIAWLNRLSCRQYEVGRLRNPALNDSLRSVRRDGFGVRFVNLTTDLGIPVVLATIVGPGLDRARDYLTFGLGSRLEPMAAAERAFIEALEMLPNSYDLADPGRGIRVNRYLLDRSGVRLPEYFDECRFLIENPASDVLEDGAVSSTAEVDLRRVVERLQGKGVDLYFCDLTPPELRHHAYRLVRVQASRLQPHLYEWDVWRLSNPRVRTAPVDIGLLAQPLADDELNLTPNPFAVLFEAPYIKTQQLAFGPPNQEAGG
jgi:ribosomal protein S12 methylthiotransferase accessory factor